MSRRRPSEVPARRRSQQGERAGPRIPQVPGVSGTTLRAIEQLERTRFSAGAIARALDRWARFVRGPARTLASYQPVGCSCPDCQWEDPAVCREALRTAEHVLPNRAARELRTLLVPLDELYLSRSIPAPETAHIRDLLTSAASEG